MLGAVGMETLLAGLTVGDLVDLAVAEGDNDDEHIYRIFQWKFERSMSLARALAGAGSGFLVALALAVAQKDASGSSDAVRLGFIGAGLAILTSAIVGWRARNIHREFITAQLLASELRTVRPFLRLYLLGRGTR